jgi:hypothetical protein
MNTLRLIAGATLLTVGACAEGRDSIALTDPAFSARDLTPAVKSGHSLSNLLRDTSLYTKLTELEQTAGSLTALLTAEQGSLGRMITDQALYTRLNSLTADLRAVLADAANAASHVTVSGQYDALVDFTTLTLTPRGNNCLLEVAGQLEFTGTIQGTATGRTSALVLAPCADVASNPPGTFGDTFKSDLVFEGTVNGEPATANLRYVGQVKPGGSINARLIFTGGVTGSVDTQNAVVAVGGDYSGNVVIN